MKKIEVFKKEKKTAPAFTLITPEFLEDMAKILAQGALKYDVDNWKLGNKLAYKEALFRHLMHYLKGNSIDKDSGHPHLIHIACNIMFLHYLEKKGETS